MSYEAVQWALHEAPMLRTPSGEPDVAARFVLVTRAERADKNGCNTFAGPADVARSTGYDERTVRLADRRLEKAGLLVRDGFSRLGTVRWRVDMTQRQSNADGSPVEERAERQRKANADRQQRYRDRLKTAAESAQPIEPDVSTKIPVTPFKGVSNGAEERYVTAFKGVSNAPDAPQTTTEPPRGTTHGTTLGGTLPPNPLRPPSASLRGTGEQNSPNGPLTPAQDQQGESLPHAREAAPVVELFPGASQEARYRPPPRWSSRGTDAIAEASARVAARKAAHQAQQSETEVS